MSMRGTFVLLSVVLAIVLARFPSLAAQASRPAAAASAASGNIEHGRYLVERVAMCVECHSGRDGRGNIIETQRYMGGSIPFVPPWPNDWAMRAPRNKGLPGYNDALALRLLTEGSIGRNGAQLRPPMPRFHMAPQDAADVIAFLRSLP
jgi:mono/diheme cytochrome c family protein